MTKPEELLISAMIREQRDYLCCEIEKLSLKLDRVQAIVNESKNDDAEIFFLKSNCTQVSLSAGRAIGGCMSEYLSSYMMRIDEALRDES